MNRKAMAMIVAHNDSEIPPQTCPTCGRPLTPRLPLPWTPDSSSLLDWLLRLQDDLDELKKAVEEAVL